MGRRANFNFENNDTIKAVFKIDPPTVNYELLIRKPKINHIELIGDKSLEDLGITQAITSLISEHNLSEDAHEYIRNLIYKEIEDREAGDTNLQNQIDHIDSLIPAEATSSNKLADKSFVMTNVKDYSSSFRGVWNTWADVPTNSNEYPEDVDGSRVPTKNDYMVVLYDEQEENGTWRYSYNGVWARDGKNGWVVEYPLNRHPLTPEEIEALDSGITKELVEQIGINQGDINDINTTIGSYGDVVTHDASEFATAEQGEKADTAVQPAELEDGLAGKIDKYEEMPAVSATDTGKIAQYVGTTNAEYINGYFYKVVESTGDTVTFTPKEGVETVVSISPENFAVFIKDLCESNPQWGSDGTDITRGGIGIYSPTMYSLSAYAGNKLVFYLAKEITEFEDAGFTFTPPFGPQQGATFVCNLSGYKWAQVDVQPNSDAVTSVNGKTGEVVLTASDVGALPDSTVIPTKISDLTDDTNTYPVDKADTLTNLTATIAELNYVDGVTSSIQTQFNSITEKIPAQASSSNQLADKNFVNSSISTNTANFIGTFENESSLEAYIGTVTNNDYAFVINSVVTDNGDDWATFANLDAYSKTHLTNFDYAWVVNGSNFDLYRFDIVNQEWVNRATAITKDSVTLNTAYNRYKAVVENNSIAWEYEYTLNNSSFTAQQWASINSGITSGDVSLIETALQPNDISNMLTTDTAQDVTNTKTFKAQQKFQSGDANGALVIGADVGETTLTDNIRKLGRVTLPPKALSNPNVAIISADTQAFNAFSVLPTGYSRSDTNTISFGSAPGDTTSTAPDILGFTIAKTHNATATADKILALEISKEQAKFNIQPNYNGNKLIDTTDIATASGSYGLVKLSDANTGLTISNSGNLVTSPASQLNIDGKSNVYKPIVPSNLDYAVKVGVTTNTNTLTDAEKTSANIWLGSVKDITVDNTSIVDADTKVAEIPVAGGGVYGVTKLSNSLVSTSNVSALTPNAINTLAKNIITNADIFDKTETYAVGDRVRYSSGYYECNTAITTPHAWDESEWTQITIQEQIDEKLDDVTIDGTSIVSSGVAQIPNASGSVTGVVKLSANLTSISDTIAATASMGNNLAKNIITGANTYSSTSTYSVGDKVRYGQYYYECNTAITSGHAWNANEWTQITIQGQIDEKLPNNIYGVSTTAASTVQKEVSIPSIKTLNVGQLIIVNPTVTSTVADSTLKLNDFDAYPMLYAGNAITTSTDSYVWYANAPVWWLFDGSNWLFAGHGYDYNTTYSAMTQANIIAGTETSARLMRSDYLKNGIFGVVTSYNSGASITLSDKYLYNNTSNITALTLVAPSSPDVRFLAQVNFSSGSTATTFSYPTTFKVIDGCDDTQYISGVRTFVPVANKRYQVFIESDGVNLTLMAKGV